jgi:putative hydrolase of the HAD superfamily
MYLNIFQLALDVSQTQSTNVVYIEDRPMFVQVAATLGIKGIHHTDYKSTMEKLNLLGLEITEGRLL